MGKNRKLLRKILDVLLRHTEGDTGDLMGMVSHTEDMLNDECEKKPRCVHESECLHCYRDEPPSEVVSTKRNPHGLTCSCVECKKCGQGVYSLEAAEAGVPGPNYPLCACPMCVEHRAKPGACTCEHCERHAASLAAAAERKAGGTEGDEWSPKRGTS